MSSGIQQIKELLLENPNNIVSLLETYGFEHIVHKPYEIRFARGVGSGLNISIQLQKNEFLNCHDFVFETHTDIFGFICKMRNVNFKDVLQTTKEILGLDNTWHPQSRRMLFGGIYSGICGHGEKIIQTYDESVLNDYIPCGNALWLNGDHITLDAQHFYDVRFSVIDNAIVFPWRDQYGKIISLKARINEKHPPEDCSKYYYLIKNNISTSLFNYSQCYPYLYGANKIYVVESEKSCMKLWGWGIRNSVAIGSHTLSKDQIKLLLQLQSTEIVLMLDNSLDLTETKKNADAIREFTRMRTICLAYWDWRDNLDLDKKSAPCDGTKEQFQYILDNEIKPITSLDAEITQLNSDDDIV